MSAVDVSGVQEHAAAGAEDVDVGRADVRPALRRLGAVGALGAEGDDPTRALVSSVRLVRQVAAVSLATAFSIWSQRMVLEYLRFCPPPESAAALVRQLRAGEVTGATALAPAVADPTGRGELPVSARPDGDGWRLSGTVGWASNLFDDAVVVVPARAPDEGRLVVRFRRTDDGVTPTEPHRLFGLNGTGTAGLHLDDVRVSPEQVLSEDLTSFIAMCRPTKLLLQTSLAVGLADAALAAAARHVGGVLRTEYDDVAAARDDVGRRMDDLAADRVGVGPGGLARLRLAGLEVAADAVRLETAVTGAGGYRAGTATARRVREAAFLPVQAPTYAQLRREVASS
ncbi:alkylation response protein AidB-like acyl-CoA dehydrogenase [Geodermatophilus bullaregiensis]|uniref:acyl-CoA dehydrogenase family protein n=1 Tax=Geodermatophilus bullaregiensis TaxID=1564160 RepID=UPI0019560C41|nr:acyl-CoA dehydrogenase family protein [Geodermatophilus bullaregiensis]MBM7807680.1 alkylation response protein AidB-like acyl-CoA dehydrogenase [Geodermatophilus bullaregiensis]